MRTKHVVWSGLAALTILFAGGAAFVGDRMDMAAQAAAGAPMALGAAGAGMTGKGHGWRGHSRHRGMHMMCDGEVRTERLNSMIGLVESFASFTPPQKSAWADLTASLQDGNAKIGTACGKIAKTGEKRTLGARWTRMQTMLDTGSSLMRTIRPKFDAFYETLNDAQKKAIDNMAMHRGLDRSWGGRPKKG